MIFVRSKVVCCMAFCVFFLVAGCAPHGGRMRTGQAVERDTARAEKLTHRGVKYVDRGELEKAEAAFEKAIEADMMFGPAHNNLGQVYLQQKKLYAAAWEFQYAIKLMPRRPEPRNNLGIVFETAGKLDQAVDAYEKAQELEPDCAEFIGNHARARIKRGDRNGTTRRLLEELIMRDTRPTWVTWAQEKLAFMNDQD